MSKICQICGKKPSFGHNVSHAHNITNRRWNPNLQTVRAMIKGVSKRIKVCTSCLKAGKVTKRVKSSPGSAASAASAKKSSLSK